MTNLQPKRLPDALTRSRGRPVEIVHTDYQPSKAELEEDLRVPASFDQAIEALAQPVRIRHIARPGPRR